MGDYTAIFIAAELRHDAPPVVRGILNCMMGLSEEIPCPLPDHPLFKSERWRYLLRCDAAYLPGAVLRAWGHARDGRDFTVYSKIKNYDEEIEKFFDWISPYVENDAIAFHKYEYADKATIVSFLKEETSDEPV